MSKPSLRRQRVRTAKSAWESAEKYGFDMSLVEARLRMTPLQRIRAHQRALNMATRLRRAVERHRA